MLRRSLLKLISSLVTLPAVSSAEADDRTVTEYSEKEAREVGEQIEQEVIAGEDRQVIEATRTAPLRVQLTCTELPSETIRKTKKRDGLQLGPITHNPRTELYSFSILNKSHSLEVVHRQTRSHD